MPRYSSTTWNCIDNPFHLAILGNLPDVADLSLPSELIDEDVRRAFRGITVLAAWLCCLQVPGAVPRFVLYKEETRRFRSVEKAPRVLSGLRSREGFLRQRTGDEEKRLKQVRRKLLD